MRSNEDPTQPKKIKKENFKKNKKLQNSLLYMSQKLKHASCSNICTKITLLFQPKKEDIDHRLNHGISELEGLLWGHTALQVTGRVSSPVQTELPNSSYFVIRKTRANCMIFHIKIDLWDTCLPECFFPYQFFTHSVYYSN